MAETSKSAKLNFGYGQLNPISKNSVGPTYEPGITSGVDVVKQQAENSFAFNTLASVGTFKGICIGIVQLPETNAANSWVERVFSFSGEDPKPLLGIKVRIPELHSMLADPFKPQAGERVLDWNVVRTYPTFIAENEIVSQDTPSIGDIVNVDFADRTTRSGPVYLGKVFDNPVGLDISITTADAFSPGNNQLNGNSPNATNNYTPGAWKPNSNTAFAGGCKRQPKPDTSGKSFTLHGFVLGKSYTFEATKIGKRIMDVRVAKDWIRMRDAAAREDVTLWIRSAFRTMQDQEYFYCKYKNGTGNSAARPGFSNHQSGVALDLNTGPGINKARSNTKEYNWLAKHGATYGFKRIRSEHWHWEHQPSLLANRAAVS